MDSTNAEFIRLLDEILQFTSLTKFMTVFQRHLDFSKEPSEDLIIDALIETEIELLHDTD